MISPKSLAATAIRELKAAADPRVAAGARAYFKDYEDIHFFGVKAPAVRRIEKDLFEQIRDDWKVQDAISCCDILIKRREQSEIHIHRLERLCIRAARNMVEQRPHSCHRLWRDHLTVSHFRCRKPPGH